jgi:L-lactate dehydrogenase complex protein LldE
VVAFEGFDHVVVPSGSCAGMIRRHFPDLLADDSEFGPRARLVAERTYELTQFLVDVLGWDGIDAGCEGKVTYHDSCSSLRELGIRDQPRRLLSKVAGLSLSELADNEACCGFGGTFCVKFPDISARMATEKTANVAASGAEMVLAGDMGCLLNIAGRLSREGHAIKVRHVAEVLAGMTDRPAIGE